MKTEQKEMIVDICVLLVDMGNKEGMAAKLVIELIEDGSGEMYSCPSRMSPFLVMDGDFRSSYERAEKFLRSPRFQQSVKGPSGLKDLWPTDADIRWYIKDLNEQPLRFTHLTGPSMGGAFLIALYKLLSESDLDLEGIAVTAEIDEKGDFHPVGGLWEKIEAVVKSAIVQGHIRKILVAKDQKDIPKNYFHPTTEKPEVMRVQEEISL